MKIDLHTHSRVSDGSDEPADLVRKAKEAGLDVVALTDHDTVAGWEKAAAAGREHEITVVLGAEFSTVDGDRGQHLLGYGFHPEHPGIAEMLSLLSDSREVRYRETTKLLEREGFVVDDAAVRARAGGIPSRKHLAPFLVRQKGVASEDEAFARWLNPGRPAYYERPRPTIEHAIRTIEAAGGVSVVAHPRDRKRDAGMTDERLAELAALGLDGVEVDHEAHAPEDRERLRRLAGVLELHATGSSDHHGDRKVDHDLGCFTTEPAVAQALLGDRVFAW